MTSDHKLSGQEYQQKTTNKQANSFSWFYGGGVGSNYGVMFWRFDSDMTAAIKRARAIFFKLVSYIEI